MVQHWRHVFLFLHFLVIISIAATKGRHPITEKECKQRFGVGRTQESLKISELRKDSCAERSKIDKGVKDCDQFVVRNVTMDSTKRTMLAAEELLAPLCNAGQNCTNSDECRGPDSQHPYGSCLLGSCACSLNQMNIDISKCQSYTRNESKLRSRARRSVGRRKGLFKGFTESLMELAKTDFFKPKLAPVKCETLDNPIVKILSNACKVTNDFVQLFTLSRDHRHLIQLKDRCNFGDPCTKILSIEGESAEGCKNAGRCVYTCLCELS